MDTPPIQGPVFLIEVEKISPNPYQPRRDFDQEQLKELASSIREFGVLQPVVVTKVETEVETGTDVRYELIAGERRLMASKMLGLERIPAVIRHVQTDRERLELAIIENVQRANLSPIEAARAYSRLSDEFNLTQREIAAKIGKSREVIANTLRLLNLPTTIQEAISKGRLSESQARLLLSLDDPAQQEGLFQEIMRGSMTVREVRSKVLAMKAPQTTPLAEDPPAGGLAPVAPPDPEFDHLCHALEEFLGARIKVKRTGDNGELAIAFYSKDELRTIFEKMLPHPPKPESDSPWSGAM